MTPLHFACENGRATVGVLLLEHGADVDAKNEVRIRSSAGREVVSIQKQREQSDALFVSGE